MPISRRELELLVDHGLYAVDDATLAKVAEIVLRKTVVIRGGKFSIKAADAQPTEPTTKSTKEPALKLTQPQVAVLLEVLAGNDRYAGNYMPAQKTLKEDIDSLIDSLPDNAGDGE
jgi:hypothetical protein